MKSRLLKYPSSLVAGNFLMQRMFSTTSVRREADVFDQIYVINLDSRPERWRSIVEQLEKAGFGPNSVTRFSAVEGNSIDAEKLYEAGFISQLGLRRLKEPQVNKIWGMDLNGGGIGCALSHIALWSEIVARKLQCALVVEDDSLFPDNFLDLYHRRCAQLPRDWELVYLSGLDTANKGHQLEVAKGVRLVHQMHRTTNCYQVNANGAAELLRTVVPLTYQLDTQMTMNCIEHSVSLEPYVKRPVSFVLHPPVVVQATRFGSDIQSLEGKDLQAEEKGRVHAAKWGEL